MLIRVKSNRHSYKFGKYLAGKYIVNMCVFKNISIPYFNSRNVLTKKIQN